MRSIWFIGAQELLSLHRRRVILLLALLLLICTGAALLQGRAQVARMNAVSALAREESVKERARWAQAAKLREEGLPTPGFPEWQNPLSALSVGLSLGGVATIERSPLAPLALGESAVALGPRPISLRAEDLAADSEELISPEAAANGALDLAFVMIFLLPLLALALSFDVVSREREHGTLPLLRLSPVPLWKIVAAKALAYTLTLSILSVVALFFVVVMLGGLSLEVLPGLSWLCLALALYTALWVGVAALCNTWRLSSSSLALAASSLWVTLLFIWPALVHQAAERLWPPPSRAAAIVALRAETIAAEKQKEGLLDRYLQDHPELAPRGDNDRARSYLVVLEHTEQQIAALHASFAEQKQSQREAIQRAQLLSPRNLLSAIFLSVSGGDADHLESFQYQTKEHQRLWFAHIKGWVMTQKKLTPVDLEALPMFQYTKPSPPPLHWEVSLLGVEVLLFWALILVRLSRRERHLL